MERYSGLPLAKAVVANDTNKINKILAQGDVSINYQEPKYGGTFLEWAVWHNKVNLVHFLLTKGANPNLHDSFNGTSPIVLSCEFTEIDPEILRLLLHYGGNPNDYVKDDEQVTYEHSNKTPLIAAATSSLEHVKILIEAGAEIDMAIHEGQTPLFRAALGNHFSIIKYLLIDCGADYRKVYYVRANGDTARFMDVFTEFPYPDTQENNDYIQQIREFINKSKKNNNTKISDEELNQRYYHHKRPSKR